MSDLTATVYLMLGSNIEPEKYIQMAIVELRMRYSVEAISPVYRSPAFGPLEDQPDFLNVAVKITTTDSPEACKEHLLAIEKKLGRNRAAQKTKFDPRTLDIDIMLWGDLSFTYGRKPWEVPDENIVKQAATAIPLADIAPDYVHPDTGQTLKQIADGFSTDSLERIDLDLI